MQMKVIETNYCEYCKHNEASINKLAEYAQPTCPPGIKLFIDSSRLKLQGRTGAWDLGSLIVKPVQRVLKYPLLIKVDSTYLRAC
jgi:RhoGEF domain